LKGTQDLGKVFKSIEGTHTITPVGYSDASFAEDKDNSRSTFGYVLSVSNGAVPWLSHRKSTVSTSTLHSELIAMHEALKESIWLDQIVQEMGIPCERPLIIDGDNQPIIRIILLSKLSKYCSGLGILAHNS
jgi:hypothetical protein